MSKTAFGKESTPSWLSRKWGKAAENFYGATEGYEKRLPRRGVVPQGVPNPGAEATDVIAPASIPIRRPLSPSSLTGIGFVPAASIPKPGISPEVDWTPYGEGGHVVSLFEQQGRDSVNADWANTEAQIPRASDLAPGEARVPTKAGVVIGPARNVINRLSPSSAPRATPQYSGVFPNREGYLPGTNVTRAAWDAYQAKVKQDPRTLVDANGNPTNLALAFQSAGDRTMMQAPAKRGLGPKELQIMEHQLRTLGVAPGGRSNVPKGWVEVTANGRPIGMMRETTSPDAPVQWIQYGAGSVGMEDNGGLPPGVREIMPGVFYDINKGKTIRGVPARTTTDREKWGRLSTLDNLILKTQGQLDMVPAPPAGSTTDPYKASRERYLKYIDAWEKEKARIAASMESVDTKAGSAAMESKGPATRKDIEDAIAEVGDDRNLVSQYLVEHGFQI